MVQLLLNCLQIGIVCTVRNRLNENRFKMEEIQDVSLKTKLASRHKGGQNMFPQKRQVFAL